MPFFDHPLVVGLDLDVATGALTPGAQYALEQVMRFNLLGLKKVVLYHSSASDEKWHAEHQRYVQTAAGVVPQGERTLADVVCRVRNVGFEVKSVTTDDRSWKGLIDTAQAHDAQTILVGKRSHLSFRERLLGSTSYKLIRKSPVSVWAVKDEHVHLPRNILAGVDMSAFRHKMVDRAVALAKGCSAELHLLHALQMSFEVEMQAEELRDQSIRTMHDVAIQKIRDELQQHQALDLAQIHVGMSSPVHAAWDLHQRFHHDLLMIGATSLSGLSAMLLGSTAERLLSLIPSSILAVK